MSDNQLYSGMTSQSFLKTRISKTTLAHRKQTEQRQLLPVADKVFAELQKERDSIALEIANIITTTMTVEEIQILVTSAKLADKRLASVQLRLSNILRRPKNTKEASDESGE